jgi:hypothetical protein
VGIGGAKQYRLGVMLDSIPVLRILGPRYHKHGKENFMFMILMDIVSIVADKGTPRW